jgi:flagellar hook-basal body complex protein FliE
MSVGPISPSALQAIQKVAEPKSAAGAEGAQRADLGDMFAKALSDARGLEKDSTQASEQFAKGEPGVGIHEVVIAAEKANISIRYATTLKNKAIEAYRELMNTQV